MGPRETKVKQDIYRVPITLLLIVELLNLQVRLGIEEDGGSSVMEDEVLLQECNHSCMFLERSCCSSLASGFSLFFLFQKQDLCFSI